MYIYLYVYYWFCFSGAENQTNSPIHYYYLHYRNGSEKMSAPLATLKLVSGHVGIHSGSSGSNVHAPMPCAIFELCL